MKLKRLYIKEVDVLPDHYGYTLSLSTPNFLCKSFRDRGMSHEYRRHFHTKGPPPTRVDDQET